MRSLYLYKITNLINSKIYIGVSLNPERRWQQHQYKSSACVKLKNAIAKHGADNFKFEVICEGSESYILDLEFKAIEAYDSVKCGYNTLEGGNRTGVSLSYEVRGKISDSLVKFYESNESPNKGTKVEKRSDDEPVCVFGFWFPNARTAISALGINRKTLYSRRKQGTLHLEARPLKAVERLPTGSRELSEQKSKAMQGKNSGEANGMFGKRNTSRHRPVIINGLTYDSITDAVRLTQYTKSQIEKRIKKGTEGFNYAI